MPLIVICDLKCPDDPQGRTYREINMAKTHQIPIGALVELLPIEGSDSHEGVRMFVVHHNRDCDGTPLYALSWDLRDSELPGDGRFYPPQWFHGLPEDCLLVVKEPKSLLKV